MVLVRFHYRILFTPFFFYSVGGYLAINGQISVGALVAALAAYKDLSSPWKELLTYYNQTQDMATRWEILLERFAPAGMLDAALIDGAPDDVPRLSGDIVLDRVTVRDGDDNTILEDLSVTLPAGKVIAIAAPSSEDRRAFAELLVREILPSGGSVTVSGHNLRDLHQTVIAARIGHATSRPVMFQGTFGENVMMPVRSQPQAAPHETAAIREAVRAGNSADHLDGPWATPAIDGLDDPEALRDWWLQLVEGMGAATPLFLKGLEQRFIPEIQAEFVKSIIAARPVVQQAIRDAGLARYVFFIKPDLYNPGLPVAENLMLATPRLPITQQMLSEQSAFIQQLKALGLDRDLTALSRDVIHLLRQTFGVDGADHPLFRKLGLDVRVYDAALTIVDRIRGDALNGLTDDEIHGVTMFDPWFLARIREIVEAEDEVRTNGLPVTEHGLRALKMLGFTDARLGNLTGRDEDNVRRARQNLGVRAVFKRIDTCAAEFEAQTPYMYSTYESPVFGEVECEARPSDRKKVVILGGGPNRIGQGIEFDYCCCHACYALTDAGFETIMINCNPETVSTDYDTSDRLYFEPLTLEHVLEILRVEMSNGNLQGVIVQFGGQTPLKLANALEEEGIPILGTSPDAIDLAEDRERFQDLVNRLGLKQPHNGIASTDEEAFKIAEEIGYPLVIRPSYVLGGRAMEIVRDLPQLERYIAEAVVVSGDSPVLLDSYLSGATEIDVDALSDGKDVHVTGIMQHIEEAGVHSGDSACSLPPYSLPKDIIEEIKRQTVALALELNVVGLMNVQFAVKDGEVYLIEVNPRASRTVPFVAKATDSAIASIAARVMSGEPLSNFPLRPSYPEGSDMDTEMPIADPMTLADPNMPWFSVKEAVLPFARFPGVDTILGPEMRSTGEVMGWDRSFPRAFLKAQLGAGTILPREGRVFVSIKTEDKTAQMLEAAQLLAKMGFEIVATKGTADWLTGHDVPATLVNKVYEGRPNIVDIMKDGGIDLVFNTTEGAQSVADSREIRSVALYDKIPYFTTAAGAHAAVLAMQAREEGDIEVRSLQG